MTEETTGTPLPDELTVLKQRAKMMGITHSNNISVDALRKKINDAMEGKVEEENAQDASPSNSANGNSTGVDAANSPSPPADRLINPESGLVVPCSEPIGNETQIQATNRFRKELIAEQMRLIRVRVQNLNPNKADIPGEIFTVANDFIGNVTKYIPYGELTDDGYHIPYCIYTQLRDRRFNHIRTGKDKHTGTPKVSTSWAKEFALEVLPPLKPEELKRLAIAQAAAGSVDGGQDRAGGETF